MIKNLRVAIVGSGKVGKAFAFYLKKKKIKIISVIDRNSSKAKRLADKIGAKIYSDNLNTIPSDTNLFIIAVQDRFILDVANQLSVVFQDFKEKYAFHCSGALTADVMESLVQKGCNVFSLHPNFSFVSEEAKNQKLINFDQSVFALETNFRKAKSFAKKFCKYLGLNFIEIDKEQKILYHIFSVMISNYTVTEFFLIKKLLGKKAIPSYLNLLKSTIQNIENFGVEKSLSGPIVREDTLTISSHLEYLSRNHKNLENIYKQFGQVTLEMMEQKLSKISLNSFRSLFAH